MTSMKIFMCVCVNKDKQRIIIYYPSSLHAGVAVCTYVMFQAPL